MIGRRSLLGGAAALGRMNAEFHAVLKSPEASGRLAEDGVVAIGGTSQAFMVTIRAEIERWQAFIARTGIRLE